MWRLPGAATLFLVIGLPSISAGASAPTRPWEDHARCRVYLHYLGGDMVRVDVEVPFARRFQEGGQTVPVRGGYEARIELSFLAATEWREFPVLAVALHLRKRDGARLTELGMGTAYSNQVLIFSGNLEEVREEVASWKDHVSVESAAYNGEAYTAALSAGYESVFAAFGDGRIPDQPWFMTANCGVQNR